MEIIIFLIFLISYLCAALCGLYDINVIGKNILDWKLYQGGNDGGVVNIIKLEISWILSWGGSSNYLRSREDKIVMH